MRKKKMLLAGLLAANVLLMTACQPEVQETKDTKATEETTQEETIDFGTVEDTEEPTEEATEDNTELLAAKRQELLNDCWLSKITGLSSYLDKPEYRIDTYIFDVDPERDRWADSERYVDWNHSSDGTYSLSAHQYAKANSVYAMEGTVGIDWNVATEERKVIRQNNGAYLMMDVLGKLYLEQTGHIEGELRANIYLTEHQKDQAGFFLGFGENEPIFVSASYVKDVYNPQTEYQIDPGKHFTSDVQSTALLKISVDMVTGSTEPKTPTVIINLTEKHKKTSPKYSSYLDGIDLNGDGFAESVRKEENDQGEVRWYLDSENGEKTLLFYTKYDHAYRVYWGHGIDVTEDGFPELVIQPVLIGANMETPGYSIRQWQNGEWKELPLYGEVLEAEDHSPFERMGDIFLKVERVGDTCLKITTIGTDYSETIEFKKEIFEEIWPDGAGEEVWLTVDGETEANVYMDPATGKYTLYGETRMGGAKLIGRLVFRDGKWIVRDIQFELIEREVPESILAAEAEGEKLQNEIWVELLEDAISVQGELFTLADKEKNSVRRVYSVPWCLREDVDTVAVDIFSWNAEDGWKAAGLGNFSQTSDGLMWDGSGKPAPSEDKITVNSMKQGSNLYVDVTAKLSRIGDPLKYGTDGYEDRCRAAELLIGAAMRYVGERYLEQYGGLAGNLRTVLYLGGNFDLDALTGYVLVEMAEGDTFGLEISYSGSCREQVADYTLKVVEESAVKDKMIQNICCNVTVKTESIEKWKYSTWQAFLEYDNAKRFEGVYGWFMDDVTDSEGRILYPAKDYDGDGLIDRVFYLRGEQLKGGVLYLVCGSGEILLFEAENK